MMAAKDQTNVRFIMVEGSDEAFEFFCDPCSNLMYFLQKRKNSRCQSKCLAKINFWRQQLDVMLDKLQTTAVQNVLSLYQDNSAKINKTSADCQTVISELQNTMSRMKSKERDENKSQLYVEIKLSRKRATIFERQIKDMKNLRISSYKICKKNKLEELECILSDMLALSDQQDVVVTKARYLRDINVKSDYDAENESGINGIAVLNGGRVVATDYDNKAVKLINTKKNNKMVSRLSIAAKPRDITKTGQNNVAVTLKNKTIVLMNIFDVISIIRIIHVPNTDMYGICSYQDSFLLVSCNNPSCLNIIDISGKVIKTLDKNMNGELLVSTPSRIAMSHDQTLVYITDTKANTVTTMTMNGKIEHVYESADLKVPFGVAVGRYGEVFLCSHTTHVIHQLSPTGQYIQIVLGEDQNLAEFPFAIEYSVEDNTLYISSGSSNPGNRHFIRVFKLE